jgi:hypothetical protein
MTCGPVQFGIEPRGRVVVPGLGAEARYDFIARIVRCFGYVRLKRADKGVVLSRLERASL